LPVLLLLGERSESQGACRQVEKAFSLRLPGYYQTAAICFISTHFLEFVIPSNGLVQESTMFSGSCALLSLASQLHHIGPWTSLIGLTAGPAFE